MEEMETTLALEQTIRVLTAALAQILQLCK
jgi:hypothetical protein